MAKIVKLFKGNEVIVPQTVAEAVLIKDSSNIITLDTYLNKYKTVVNVGNEQLSNQITFSDNFGIENNEIVLTWKNYGSIT